MDLKDFEISDFVCKVKALNECDYEKFGVSHGSMQEAAKSLFPDTFNPDLNIDVLPVVFNLAVVNEFNKNGDGIDSKTAIAAVKQFINKPINIEHKKHKIVGHMINASFSEEEFDFNDNDINSYAEKTEPFYINAAGLIYKNIFPELAQAIQEAADEDSDNYQSISTSWELAFKNYKVVYGSNKLSECQEASGAQANEMKKYVKGFGGRGQTKDGVLVNRLIYGETYPLGAALTYNPAARVEGVYLNDKKNNNINSEKISLNSEKNVKKGKFDILNMDKEQFEQLMTQVAESIASVVKKDDQAESIGEIMRNALSEHSETWKSKVQLEAEARAKAEQDLEQLKESFDSVKQELDAIKADLETQAAVDLFNSRMNFIDSTYELTEAELKFVTDELKVVEASDESFESFKEKISIIFAHKSKEAIAAKEQEIADRIEQAIASKLQESTASEKEGDEGSDEKEDEELELEETATASIPNNNGEQSCKQSLVEKLKENFQVEVSH